MANGLTSSGSVDDIDWKSYEVDDETLEDIEISLYGMLHHANTEENFPSTCEPTVNPTNYSIDSSCVEINEDFSESTKPTVNGQDTLSRSSSVVNTQSYEESKVTLPEPSSKPAANGHRNISRSPSPEFTGRGYWVLKGSNDRKNPKDSTTTRTRKYKPFSEYITIEHSTDASSNSCRKASKTSTIIDISDDDEDSKYKSFSKIASKRNHLKNPTKKVCNSDGSSSESDDSIMVVDASNSSDSESEIKVIESSVNNSPLKLNISGTIKPDLRNLVPVTDENNLAISPQWQKYSCSKWTQEMIDFYDKDGEGRDLEMIAASLPRNARWFVDNSDRFGDLPSFRKNRYFTSKSRIRCLNCNQWDHVARDCREPKKITCCHVCGDPGHTPFQCPNKVCFGCGRPSKIYIECCPDCRRERNAVCLICKLSHLTTQCPDLWRRYHMTTTQQDKPTATTASLKPDHLQKCYLCAGSGHLPFNCKVMRPSKYLLPNPAVFQYEDSSKFLDELTDGGRNSVVASDSKSLWVVGAPPTSSLSYSRTPKVLKYSICDTAVSCQSLDSARSSVMKSVSNVQIEWRRQPKKHRFFVEFSGHGDRLTARNQFKKMLTFKRDKNGGKTSTLPVLPVLPVVTPAPTKEASTAPPKNMQKITVIHRNSRNKQLRCSRELRLSPREQNRLGKLLVKLESRYRVAITSSKLPNEWEIFVNSRTENDFSSVSASSSCIINHLNKCS